MKDFLKYILSEVKSKRLTKKEATDLISQYQNGGTQGNNNFLHPLLHQNTSDLSEQRFSSTFTGQEFFLAEHIVTGRKVLPGVAYLEMAREAIQYAAGTPEEGRTGVTLENVAWVRPVVLERDEEKLLHIGLYPEENGNVSFRIYTRLDKEEEDVVYCEGSAVLSDIPEVKTLNINSLRAECREGSLSSGRCYEMFGAMGVDYGLSYRNLEKLYLGRGKVLARLSLPASLSDTLEQFVMHPGMMDAALQASVGLAAETKELKPSLPFAVQKVEILAGCTSKMWALVKNCDADEGNKTQKIDVDLCDDEGNVCVRVRGFSTRKTDEFKNEALSDLSACGDNSIDGTVMLAPVWDTIRLNKGDAVPYPTGNVVIAGGTKSAQDAIKEYCPKAHILGMQTGDTIEGIIKNVEALGEIDHIIWISPYSGLKSVTDDDLNDGQESGVLQVFRLIKAMLGNGYGIKSLEWTFITTQSQPVGKNDRVDPTHASVCGLVGSMAKEYPNWKVRIVDMEEECKWPVSDILTLPYDPNGNLLAYRGTEWYRQKLIPIDWTGQEGSMYRKDGVYVVIGGAGGIGEVWSEYMIRTYQAKIIWIGRREKDGSIQEKLDRLAAFALYFTKNIF
ncbi:MAG TPA: polyketide synthase dehydratase domain-containing protein [Clostridia bacterium]|nr:polyketide synthase dehydratase domain-containing protein [Clostridia bacterium]